MFQSKQGVEFYSMATEILDGEPEGGGKHLMRAAVISWCSEHRALAGLAGHCHVAAHHTREPARIGVIAAYLRLRGDRSACATSRRMASGREGRSSWWALQASSFSSRSG